MMDNVKGIPYRLGTYNKHSVTGVESVIDLGESVCLCHNSGANTIYIGPATGVSSDNMELKSDERIFLGGIIYVIGAGATELKVQQLLTAYI